MKRKYIVTIFGIISFITVILVVLGLVFNKTELEKINGFTSQFAIAQGGQIAYVNYNEGAPEICLRGKGRSPLITLDAEKEITDITFSPDGTRLFYVVNEKDIDNTDQLTSVIYYIHTDSRQTNELLREDKIITEITFDPKDDEALFYLAAETFENYSPVARKAPHDFDIYRYSFQSDEISRQTEFKKYSMASLQISHAEQIAYVQMIDDMDTETADETFAAKQKIFEIPLEDPESLKVISDIGVSDDIYDMFYMYQDEKIIFQAVSQTSDEGIFEYELFELDLKEKEKSQLTYLKEHTAQPTYSVDDDKIYFVVDKQFAKKQSDYYLYRMNRDGSQVEQVNLK